MFFILPKNKKARIKIRAGGNLLTAYILKQIKDNTFREIKNPAPVIAGANDLQPTIQGYNLQNIFHITKKNFPRAGRGSFPKL
jgi:hypothetical protein